MNKITKLIAVIALLAFGFASTAHAFSIGQRGGEVADLQITLIEAGFDIPAITSGAAQLGYFGVQTQRALTAYEASKATSGLTLGAVSTLDGVDNPFVSINGLKQYYYSQNTLATSSVLCSIKNPFTNSTSTLLSYGVSASINGIGAQNLYISTSTTAFGSSTPAYVDRFAAPATPFSLAWGGVATTTGRLLIGIDPVTGASDNIIRPGEYVTLRVATSTAGVFGSYVTGVCTGVLQKL